MTPAAINPRIHFSKPKEVRNGVRCTIYDPSFQDGLTNICTIEMSTDRGRFDNGDLYKMLLDFYDVICKEREKKSAIG
jgi:hypothetical protein